MASGKSIQTLGIDAEELLKTYRLSSLKPTQWQDTDLSASGGGDPATSSSIRSGRGEEDPLGLLNGPILTDVNPDIRTKVSITSKSFDPKAFLSSVHPNASFSDLKKGGSRLREILEQRSEALKILVESEFDRFVAVKVANEAVYEQMKAGPLKPESDYSTADLKESLRLAILKSDQVYSPLLENRKKAERLRSTLGVFERSKFFFNLPGTLVEAIQAERYDTALLAYKRGRNMLDSKPSQALNLPTPNNPEGLGQQKRIFDKVWLEVEKVVDEFKARLYANIMPADGGLPPVEEAEKTIEILLELDSADDPAWTFCENQHKSIMGKLTSFYQEAAQKTLDTIKRSNSSAFSEDQSASDLRDCVALIELPTTAGVGNIAASAMGADVWRVLLELIRIPSELLSKEIVAFWTIINGYLNGKYQRSDSKMRKDTRARRSISCKQMANEVISCYASLLSGFFLLTSDPNSTLARSPVTELPEFAPKHSNSIQAAFYLRQLMNSLSDWCHDISNLGIPEEGLSCLKEFLVNARYRFTSTLGAYWVIDSKAFHFLEDWTRPERGEHESHLTGTTVYLQKIYDFHQYIMLNSYILAGGNEQLAPQIFTTHAPLDQPLAPSKKKQPPPISNLKIKSAFLDALYGCLDGLVHIAFATPQSTSSAPDTPKLALGISLASLSIYSEKANQDKSGVNSVDEEVDMRLLLSISNLANLTTFYIPKLFQQLSEAFSLDLTPDMATLSDVIGELDTLLLGDYIKRKTGILSEIIQTGVLNSHIDWLTAPKPTEVHSFVYDALLLLVLVHAQVTSVVGPASASQSSGEALVNTILSTLTEELANECLKAFGSVPQFGMGGMLQATLEIEFIHRTLSSYVTPQADMTMQSIYQKIGNAYQRAMPLTGAEADDTANELQRELEILKRTLHSCRRTTALAFICFKKPKISSSSPHEEHSLSSATPQTKP
ncbi:hypothetical protein O181_021033 [Austropuccinia psidii MF-1]|uniref:Exocyst complex component SEC5 n=1 Tax=Austropuccinia psidii MF-1 TaxID=1389203 RepID=A0A9Q3CE41_9BASI|nr:hypothetical protein [Austropuccinia psidii MF-1]